MTHYLIFRAFEDERSPTGFLWECVAKVQARGAEDAVEQIAAQPEMRTHPTAPRTIDHWAAVPILNFTWVHVHEETQTRFTRLEVSPAPGNQPELPLEEPEPTETAEPEKPKRARKSSS